MKNLVAGLALVALAGCWPEKDLRDEGYDDGYAVGFNTTCQIRATLIRGEWDNASYSEGYEDGHADGAADCLAGRQS